MIDLKKRLKKLTRENNEIQEMLEQRNEKLLIATEAVERIAMRRDLIVKRESSKIDKEHYYFP